MFRRKCIVVNCCLASSGFIAMLAVAAECQAQSAAVAVGSLGGSPAAAGTLGRAIGFAIQPQGIIKPYDRSRGFYQRTAFGLQDFKKRIEIAFVIDGTDSMGRDILSLKDDLPKWVESLDRALKQNENNSVEELGVAVVVYRDLLSAPGGAAAVEVLTRRFIDVAHNKPGMDEIIARLNSIPLMAGEPYFEEQVDRGLYAALTELDWTPVDEPGRRGGVTRLVILAGDAPPFDEAVWMDPALNARNERTRGIRQPLRAHKTQDLAALAAQKGITVHAVLCQSDFGRGADVRDNEVLAATAAGLRARWNDFARTLADQTRGSVFDLNDAGMLDALGRQPAAATSYQELKPFDKSDLEKFENENRVRVVVLPPMPLRQIDFAPSQPPTAFASKLCAQLMKVPGFDVALIWQVEEAWKKGAKAKAAAQAPDDDVLKALADELNARFVVWGDYASANDASAGCRLYIFDANGGKPATLEVAGPSRNDLLQHALVALSQASGPLARTGLVIANQRPPAAADDHLFWGEFHLEAALAFKRNDDQGRKSLLEARREIDEVLRTDPENPWAWYLVANHVFNTEAGGFSNENARQALAKAHTFRAKVTEDAMRLEIEADYALFIDKDPAAAVAIYEQLAQKQQLGYTQRALRALWMLAGLHLGDFGAAQAKPTVENVDAATKEILTIMLNWPDSPEAKYYEQFLDLPPERRPRTKPSLASARRDRPQRLTDSLRSAAQWDRPARLIAPTSDRTKTAQDIRNTVRLFN